MCELIINPKESKGIINRNIYGHFSEHLGRCIYQGLYVGEDSPFPNVNGMRADVIQALRNLRVPVLRWPGGCFADEYHWQDAIGPKELRRRMVNTHWGGVVEDNSFGTHEFMELCRQLDCEPYVNANVGSGTVREMADWVEYLNSDGDSTTVRQRWANGRKEPYAVKYWGIGNESWGCGGNMRPEYYADEYRKYQTYCRDYGNTKLYKIACGPSNDDYSWTEALMRIAGPYMDALTMHYYTLAGDTWSEKGSATEFTAAEYYKTLCRALRMDEIISGHLQVMHRYDPAHRVGLIVDEWGTWFDVEPGTNPGFLYQQNTMRDAMVAALTLNIFNRHCDRVVMANLAQTVNVLQAVVLTEGNKMVLTPTYHVFELFKAHQDAQEVSCFLQTNQAGAGEWKLPQISASASTKEDVLTLTLANASADAPAQVHVKLIDAQAKQATARILSGAMNTYNDFNNSPLTITKHDGVKPAKDGLSIDMPACSVMEVTVQ